MAVGTKFYLMGLIATVIISLVILIMTRFNWYARPMMSQVLRIQLPVDLDFAKLFDDVFLKYTASSELISVDSVRSGSLTELTYSIGVKNSSDIQAFLTEIKRINGNNKVTLLAGYNNTDL